MSVLLFHSDRLTDRRDADSRFSQFLSASKSDV